MKSVGRLLGNFRKQLAQADFSCAACEKPAARVTLLPPNAPDPRYKLPRDPTMPPGVERLGEENMRLSIDGGPWTVTRGPIKSKEVPAIKKALAAADPEGLAAIDYEYASFYCRKCKSCYCQDHWQVETYYDEGFYDCSYGTCPQGHRSKIDD